MGALLVMLGSGVYRNVVIAVPRFFCLDSLH